jgi:hypothetical protein
MDAQLRKSYRLKNLEKEKAYNLDWNRKNRVRLRETNRNYIKQERVKQRRKKNYLLREYNLTVEQYNQMFVDQGGLCAICDKNLRLVVDHCHLTGKIRGLLCDRCNRGLGYFKDNPKALLNASKYILRIRQPAPQGS